MVNEVEVRNITDGAGAAETPGSTFVADPLKGIRATKRWTKIGVYLAILGYGPLYLFVLGYQPRQVLTSWMVGFIIATIAIEYAFTQVFKLRKRSAYPGVILAELGRGRDLEPAAQLGLDVIQRLVGARAAFVALGSADEGVDLAAVAGVSREAAEHLLQVGMPEAREAMRCRQPVPINPGAGMPAETGLGRDERLFFIPVVALEQPIGVLALVGRKGNGDLKDGQLLSSIGVALGLSLESLRQKQELRESEERYRDLFENANDIVYAYSLDPPGKITSLNKAAERVTGYTLEEISHLNIAQLAPPESNERAAELLKRQFAGEAPGAIEVEVIAKDGHRVWLETSPRLIVKDGKPVAVHAIARDITERKRAEEALRATEERLRSVVASTPIVLFALDREGVFTLSEGKGLDALGLKPGEVVGQSVFDLYGDSPQILANIQRALAGDTFTTVVEVHGLVFESWYSPLRDENGEISGGMGVATDITERMRAEEALRRREQEFKTLAENAPDIIARFDRELRHVYVNPAVERVLGMPPEAMIGKTHPELGLPQELYSQWQDSLKKVFETGRASLIEFETPGGSSYYQSRLVPEFGEDGSIEFVLTITRDITERKRAEDTLRESEAKFRTLTETVAAAAFIYQGTRMRYVNSAAEAMTGYAREELLAMDFWDVIHPAFRERVRENGLARQRGEQVPLRYEVKILTRNGDERWVDFTAGVIEFEGKPAVLGTAFDITERKQAEATILHLAYHDALTDLPNRTLFQDRLTVALAQARRKKRTLAVLFLDLDQFKVVNDTVGHAEGDKLLQRVAERLTGLVREGDTVARVGGDEFAVLSSEIANVEDAAGVAERVLEGLRRPWALQGQEFRVTTSIGIALYPGDGDDAQTLLRNADTAMYRAKERGRDNYQLYTPAMNARIAERLAVENSLRHGLERGEFVVYYQPQVDISSGRIVGTEALVRWQHPERGLVLPGDFIPVAEDTGLIVPLGEWVLRTACAQNKAWQRTAPPLRVAVNLSARQFQQRNLIENVAQVLAETGLDPHCLQLEITEGVAMQDVDFTIAVLRDLRAMGVQISIDDFGTGYSSLSYLKRFPIDVVKIDRSFVRDLTVDESDAAIATTVIAIAHNLRLRVIAEGVETEQQLAFLRERRCDEMQGYLFSRPVPAAKLEKILARGKRRSRAKVPVDSP